MGVHPKHVNELSSAKFQIMSSLLCSPLVLTLCEVGLDRSVPSSKWQEQRVVLRKVLTLLTSDRVLILHLRGARQDPTGQDVSADCILIETHVDRMQRIHLHCFKGNREMVGRWLTHFPNAHFGFTAAVTSFSDEQIEGLRSIPEDKLLLETDSQYMRPNGGGTNTRHS